MEAPNQAQKRLATLVAQFEERIKYQRTWLYNPGRLLAPTDKQLEFHAIGGGAGIRFRLFSANNQGGKTLAGSEEFYYHMSGEYPDWWTGLVIKEPNKWWFTGPKHKHVRDNAQRLLLGEGRDWGSGSIPRSKLAGEPIMARGGIAGLVDSFQVHHKSGGLSTAWSKSYDEDVNNWTGETINGGIWFDEEPPADKWAEGKARLIRYRGVGFITSTPNYGMTDVIRGFFEPRADDPEAAQRRLVISTLDDCPFYSSEEKAIIMANWPEHERRARIQGIPTVGEGLIFMVPDEDIRIPQLQMERWYRRIVGLDVGVAHPTAAVWIAYDPDSDIIYVYGEYKLEDPLIAVHASAIKARGDWIPVAWPHDALKKQHDPAGRGNLAISEIYRKNGVRMLPESARYDDDRGGSQSVEPIIHEVLERMRTGRLKVCDNLRDWFREKANYHRKNGQPVDYMDDLLKATMYAVMSLRFAKPDLAPVTQATAQSNYDPLSSNWSPGL